ncbi:hypothetical protein LSG31_19475 [Fodinisporobacter ferrooxydans]|uniref:Uncharacterized protein n=1 Tax=Fodinisporobacter ferrooxydans TaxID=2901836 RepID=A0ABY4CL91_9BACL|nr:hypothetical protein LSG31_19475 [Alicyclobacillaceae bacterium MYW30-H2]
MADFTKQEEKKWAEWFVRLREISGMASVLGVALLTGFAITNLSSVHEKTIEDLEMGNPNRNGI